MTRDDGAAFVGEYIAVELHDATFRIVECFRTLMRISLLSLAVALAFLSVARAADKAAGEPPVQFLQTDVPWARRALAIKITADFRDAPIREVIDYLKRAAQMNTVMKLDAEPAQAAGAPKKLPNAARDIPGAPVEATPAAGSDAFNNVPKFTRKFDGVPLRTVYYQLSQDTGLAIEWLIINKKPFGIMIRNQ
jgi:hypothetical protein